jgi:hypothetical protein
MRVAMGIYLLVHGLCHFVGFVVPWKIMTMKEEPYRTTLMAGAMEVGDIGIRLVGILWLLACVSFMACGIWALASWPWWRAAILPLALASSVLCVLGLPGAKIGILANGLVLAYLAGAGLRWLPEIK